MDPSTPKQTGATYAEILPPDPGARGAHLMLKVRTAIVNDTLDRDHAIAERWARRPFRRAA